MFFLPTFLFLFSLHKNLAEFYGSCCSCACGQDHYTPGFYFLTYTISDAESLHLFHLFLLLTHVSLFLPKFHVDFCVIFYFIDSYLFFPVNAPCSDFFGFLNFTTFLSGILCDKKRNSYILYHFMDFYSFSILLCFLYLYIKIQYICIIPCFIEIIKAFLKKFLFIKRQPAVSVTEGCFLMRICFSYLGVFADHCESFSLVRTFTLIHFRKKAENVWIGILFPARACRYLIFIP